MIQHVLLFSFREDTTDADLAAILTGLAEFPQHYPAMRDFVLGSNVSERDTRFTHAMTVRFETREELTAYLSSESHEEFVRTRFAPVIAERAIASVEVFGAEGQ